MEFPWLEDTDPKAREVYFDAIRKMSRGERVAKVFEMNKFVDALQRAGVRRMYPEADEREILLRVAARRLDRETMIRVFQWDPELHR